MNIAFSKFHGTGNDFILVDDRELQFPVSMDLIAGLCHRQFGVGADGLILLRNAKGADFGMTYFNADGRESTMCGNGGRCIIGFADFLSLTGNEPKFLAMDGLHQGVILDKTQNEWRVALKMSDVEDFDVMGDNLFINTGSPHLVCFASDIHALDVFDEGQRIRYSEKFREKGTNIDFVEVLDDLLFVRTYERGVENETLSCGTGVTASALALAIRTGLSEGKLKIGTLGGELTVSFAREGKGFTDIWLTGPARLVFHGTIDIENQKSGLQDIKQL